jgi:hypothetical protein
LPQATTFPTGYHFPPKHSFLQSARLMLCAYLKWVRTPFGICVTVYWLNVVAWGGMIFLLMCNAGMLQHFLYIVM